MERYITGTTSSLINAVSKEIDRVLLSDKALTHSFSAGELSVEVNNVSAVYNQLAIVSITKWAAINSQNHELEFDADFRIDLDLTIAPTVFAYTSGSEILLENIDAVTARVTVEGTIYVTSSDSGWMSLKVNDAKATYRKTGNGSQIMILDEAMSNFNKIYKTHIGKNNVLHRNTVFNNMPF